MNNEKLNSQEKCISLEEGTWYYGVKKEGEESSSQVFWQSSDPEVAAVNENTGYVYGVKEGNATISAIDAEGKSVGESYEVNVAAKVYVFDVKLELEAMCLRKNERFPLEVTVSPSNASNKKLIWYSTKPEVADVDENGVVIGLKAGTASICVYSQESPLIRDCCVVGVGEYSDIAEEDTGKTATPDSYVADPVDAYSGAHVIKNTIMTLFGGQNLSLTAEYDSTKLGRGKFGIGWHHNFEKKVDVCRCEAKVYTGTTSYSTYTSVDEVIYTCTTPNKLGYVLTVDDDDDAEYPYIIDCNKERTEYYNEDGYLAKIADHQGFETLITYSDDLITITDTVSGKKMYLEIGVNGLVSKVYDDYDRQAVMEYDVGRLKSITDVRGNKLSYTYNYLGQVLSGTDGENIKYFTNTYNKYGRVATQKDAITDSNVTEFTYEDAEKKRIVKNREGKTCSRTYNDKGLLVSYTDHNGNTKTYEYDSRNNITKETDAEGYSVTKVYNGFNKPTSITDKNGYTTTIQYDTKGNVTKIIYPEENGVVPQETFVYNTRNQLTSHTDLRGTVTVYTYDDNGMPKTKKVGNKNAEQYNYVNGLLMSHTDARNNTTTYTYNQLGQMETKTDALNRTTRYEYDDCGNLTKLTDANGKTTSYVYDCNQQKISVTDAKGNETEYSYNGNMKNEFVTLPDNNIIEYQYDFEDRVKKIIDQEHNTTEFTYDDEGRLRTKKFADNSTVQYEYDKVGNVTREINQKGGVTDKTYDGRGNVLTATVKQNATATNGDTTIYTYNSRGQVVRTVNAVSGATNYVYSPAGDLLSETNALGKTTTYTYDAYGNKLTSTDPRGKTTTYTYDDNNNLLTVRDALGNVTTYEYDCLNQLTKVTDAKNHTVEYGYDALGRRTTVKDAKGNTFTTEYDGNGNVTKVIDAKGKTVSETVYNSLNLPATVVDNAGKTITYTYTALGKIDTIKFNEMEAVQQYSYDSLGRNTAVRDLMGGNSNAEYDVLGNVTRLKGPTNVKTDYLYDNLGRLTTESTPFGSNVEYTYNALSLKATHKNARGNTRTYSYDVMGRMMGYGDTDGNVSYTYDDNGNVLTVTDENGTITRQYDDLNRVISYTDTYGKTIGYEYDAVGNITKIIYPDNTAVNYSYDENNCLVCVTDWANRTTLYTYDENKNVTGVVKPDGSITTTVYDDKQRVVSTEERTAAGSIIVGFSYIYDNLGRISSETHLAENKKMCYTYDDLSRVTAKTIIDLSDNSETQETYSYDAAGNIMSAPESSFNYLNNRLITYNGQGVSFDADGNMTSALMGDGRVQFGYDFANRLISAGEVDYTYNAENTRIRTWTAAYNTTYTYNTNCALSQLLTKTTNGFETKYVYGLGLIAEEKGDNFKTYHFDYRGSTVALTDISGAVTDTFKYDAYGKLTQRTGTSYVIFRYNGRDGAVSDRNGLVYMRARYYSPEHKRFVNADILHGGITDSTSLNRYAYVNGNPVSFVDPLGLSKDERGARAAVDELYRSVSGTNNKTYSLNTHGLPSSANSSFRNWKKTGAPYAPSIIGGSSSKFQLAELPIDILEEIIYFFKNDTYNLSDTFVDNGTWLIEGGLSGGNSTVGASNGASKEDDDTIWEGFWGFIVELNNGNANGIIRYGSEDTFIALKGNMDLLNANLNAGLNYKEKPGVQAGAGASVLEGGLVLEIQIGGVGVEIDASAEVLSAGAEIYAGMVQEKGRTKVGFDANAGLGYFGGGFGISVIF